MRVLFLHGKNKSRDNVLMAWKFGESFSSNDINMETITKKTILNYRAKYDRIYIQYDKGVIEV